MEETETATLPPTEVKNLVDFFTSKNRAVWSNPEIWTAVNPNLTITSSSSSDHSDDDDEEEEEKKKDETIVHAKPKPKPTSCVKPDCNFVNSYRRTCLIEDGCVLADKLFPDDDDSEYDDDDVDVANTPIKPQHPNITPPTTKQRKEQLIQQTETTMSSLIVPLAEGIRRLHTAHSLPATFILLYDEAWRLAQIAYRNLAGSMHEDNVFNFDVLAWYIDPEEGMAGFSPHRDRQPKDTKSLKESFHPDGQAKYVTNWMALTDATPENSCLYVIPKPYDPGYLHGDDDDDDDDENNDENNNNNNYYNNDNNDNDNDNNDEKHNDPLSRALPTKESYQHIRAIPRKAGQSVFFTHRLLHWGSRGIRAHHQYSSKRRRPRPRPRIAISFVASDPTFEQPYLKRWRRYWNPTAVGEGEEVGVGSNGDDDDDGIIIPPFRIRLLLLCAQLLIYYDRFRLTKTTIKVCYDYCRDNQHELDTDYWRKVSLEFLKAMRQADHQQEEKEHGVVVSVLYHQQPSNESAQEAGGANNDSEEEDNILDAMLQNSDHSDVNDDYDEMDDDCSQDDNDRDDLSEGFADDEGDKYDDVGIGSLFGPTPQTGTESGSSLRPTKAREERPSAERAAPSKRPKRQ